MKCFNCDNKAEHQHHVVPKVKGGTKTVPLCTDCHSKVHDTTMATSYLIRLGLMKAYNGYLAYIFWEYFVVKNTVKSIAKECTKTEGWVKNQISKMLKVQHDDLIDILAPILKPNESKFYNRQYLKTIIIQNQL